MANKITSSARTLSRTPERLDLVLNRAISHLLNLQHEEGYWWGELESNMTITAEHLFLTHILGMGNDAEWKKIAAQIKKMQREDGSWAIWYDGPGDLSTTVESYVALKMAGVDPDSPEMAKAREWIMARGGVERVRNFTKIWLALMGEWPWEGLPVIPPEVVLLPRWFLINIYEFGSWARGTMVPLTVVYAHRPTFPIPSYARTDELFPRGRANADLSLPKKRSGWGRFFTFADKVLRVHEHSRWKPLRKHAIKAAEEWIIARQEADGCWGGIQPAWVYSLIALYVLGHDTEGPILKKGIEGLKRYSIEEDGVFRFQSCISPVWDTGLVMIALQDAGLPSDHSALVKAGKWLLNEQIFVGGDWQVKCNGRPGGWAFEFDNDVYPDTDDSSVVMMALDRTKLDGKGKAHALDRGLEWLLAMQSSNGGWGAFDRNNTRALLREIPFADFGEMIDPPSVDVTAHIVELLGQLGYRKGFRPLDRALAYLKREQEPDGAWYGRWGVNRTYGIGYVLPALAAVGEDRGAPYVRRAVDWLISHQNEDGGWGERVEGYYDPTWRGRGPSTSSQTAWAILGLIAAAEIEHPATVAGINYLLRTQREDGGWDQAYFTGTGFPPDFMINYHLYRDLFPVMALGRYRDARRGDRETRGRGEAEKC